MKTAVVICPGRGTYNKAELGYLHRHHADKAALFEAADRLTRAAQADIPLSHPDADDLAFLYGSILTDGRDEYSDQPTRNICVFADRQVDRSPTGSGVKRSTTRSGRRQTQSGTAESRRRIG